MIKSFYLKFYNDLEKIYLFYKIKKIYFINIIKALIIKFVNLKLEIQLNIIFLQLINFI